jgi:hypothetical protein
MRLNACIPACGRRGSRIACFDHVAAQFEQHARQVDLDRAGVAARAAQAAGVGQLVDVGDFQVNRGLITAPIGPL